MIPENEKVKIQNSKDSISFKENNEKRFYLFFCKTILEKSDELYNILIKPASPVETLSADRLNSYNIFKNAVKNSIDARKVLYKKEFDSALKLFSDNKNIIKEFKPYDNSTDRTFNYEILTNPSNDDKKRLINILFVRNNSNSDKKTFNGKKKLT